MTFVVVYNTRSVILDSTSESSTSFKRDLLILYSDSTIHQQIMRCPRALFLGLLVFPFVYTSTLPIPCPHHSKPRVRREFRSLPLSIRQRVFDAHWIMRNLTTAEGQARYGPNFISYEDLVVSHACANRDPRCDQGHFGPIFAIFHRALLLQFENSLLAIDPKIGAMPYWNVAFDAKGGKFRDDPRNYIFSEHFFGSKRGDPKANFAVLNGQFARFPVAKYDPMRHGPASNSSLRCLQEDWLRFPGNSVCRRCCGVVGCVCDRDDDVFDTFTRSFEQCSPYTIRNYEEFPLMDGTREFLFTQENFDTCTNSTLIRSIDQWQRCIELERSSCFFPNIDVSTVPGDTDIKLKTLAYLATENTTCAQQGYYFDRETGERVEVNAHHSQVHFKIAGDMRDPATSPNDPIFMVYHADIDRNIMTWQVNTPYLEESWWKYPVDQTPPPNARAAFSGPYNIYHLMQCGLVFKEDHPEYEPYSMPWIPGTLLNDVLNSGYPITNIFGEVCPTRPYTTRDIIEQSTPSSTTYTYDTLEHLYESCEIPEPTCER